MWSDRCGNLSVLYNALSQIYMYEYYFTSITIITSIDGLLAIGRGGCNKFLV